MASASGRSRSSRRVSPPGVAELLRPDSPDADTSKPRPSAWQTMPGRGPRHCPRRLSYSPCASAARTGTGMSTINPAGSVYLCGPRYVASTAAAHAYPPNYMAGPSTHQFVWVPLERVNRARPGGIFR